MKTEKRIQDEIRIELSKTGLIFRTNAGEFYQGKLVYSQEFNQMVLINLRKVQGLPEGFTDLLYLTDGMVAFIETKRQDGKLREDQERFINRMRSMHHRAGIARSVEDALKIIGGDL